VDGGVVVCVVVACICGTAKDSLEGVAVEMDGMPTGIDVVEYYFDDLTFLQDKGVGVLAVDSRVVGE
jgi:hypothetical protein